MDRKALRGNGVRRTRNDKGAELVEWSIWVGVIAVVAATAGTAIGPPLINLVSTMLGGS